MRKRSEIQVLKLILTYFVASEKNLEHRWDVCTVNSRQPCSNIATTTELYGHLVYTSELPNLQATNSVNQCHTETSRITVAQLSFTKPAGSLQCSKAHQLDSTLSQLNPVHTFTY
jgi:hypothetical protein